MTSTVSPEPVPDLVELGGLLDRTATEHAFSGVISIDHDGGPVFVKAYGLADRRHGIANTVQTRFGLASVAKGFTALTVMSLVEDGTLALDTRVRDLLGSDLPEIDDAVTIEHLLAHESGIGDYLDEDADGEITDYVLPVPTHLLAGPEDYLPVLDGHPQVFTPGERFAYNNSGYVVLALAAERASGIPYHELIRQRVLDPAGMFLSGFDRLDDLPAHTATGYLGEDSDRTNALHLPVRGVGDGGLSSTAEELYRFWRAVNAGTIVSAETVAAMARPRNDVKDEGTRYGLGFWLDGTGSGIALEGYDAGVSARTRFDPTTKTTVTIAANTSEGAWPVIAEYMDWLDGRIPDAG